MDPRPFYLVAHRVNDVAEIQSALEAGANAIEGDVRGDVVDHDGIFPWSTRLDPWLDEVARAATMTESFALLYLDVKEPESLQIAVERVSTIVPPTLPVLFSVSSLASSTDLAALVPMLSVQHGIGIDEYDDVEAVAAFYRGTGFGRCWYGNGVFVAGPPTRLSQIEASIRSAVTIRDADQGIRRVVVWTLRRESSMRYFIDIGVDAILANQNSLPKLLRVINSNPFVRPASRHDPAF